MEIPRIKVDLYLQETRPRQRHMEIASCVLRYLKGTLDQGILIPRTGCTELVVYYVT